MWRLSLKDRRRHGELMSRLDAMKADPYLYEPEGYEQGQDPDEDGKYRKTQEAFLKLVQEIDELEQKGREGN